MHYIIVGSFKPATKLSILDNMYLGYFNTETSGPIPNGEIKDASGLSAIGELSLGSEEFEFTQLYEDGRRVRYSLRRDKSAALLSNEWAGTCCDNMGNTRHTKCILTAVDLRFLA